MDEHAGRQPPCFMPEHDPRPVVGTPREKLLGRRQERINPAHDHHHEHQDAGRQQQRSDHDARGRRHQVASKRVQIAIQRAHAPGDLGHLGKSQGDAPDQPGIEPVKRGIHALAGCISDRPQVTSQRFGELPATALERQRLTGPERDLDRSFARWHDTGPLRDQGVIHSVSPDRHGTLRPIAAAGLTEIPFGPVKPRGGQDDLALKAPGIAVDERHQQLIFHERQLRAQRQVQPPRRKLRGQVDLRELRQAGTRRQDKGLPGGSRPRASVRSVHSVPRATNRSSVVKPWLNLVENNRD